MCMYNHINPWIVWWGRMKKWIQRNWGKTVRSWKDGRKKVSYCPRWLIVSISIDWTTFMTVCLRCVTLPYDDLVDNDLVVLQRKHVCKLKQLLLRKRQPVKKDVWGSWRERLPAVHFSKSVPTLCLHFQHLISFPGCLMGLVLFAMFCNPRIFSIIFSISSISPLDDFLCIVWSAG